MKRKIVFLLTGTFFGLIGAVGLSILGHYKIWKFTNSLNDNIFIAAVAGLVIALLSLTSSSETGKGMPFYSTVIQYGRESGKKERGKVSSMVLFFVIFVLLCILSFSLPETRL